MDSDGRGTGWGHVARSSEQILLRSSWRKRVMIANVLWFLLHARHTHAHACTHVRV